MAIKKMTHFNARQWWEQHQSAYPFSVILPVGKLLRPDEVNREIGEEHMFICCVIDNAQHWGFAESQSKDLFLSRYQELFNA